jgi:hypothetical protein
MCRRLFGLLCHYVFWNIVHPFVRQALVAAKAQQGHLMDRQQHQDPAESMENSAFLRRKSMMNFSTPDLKSMVGLAAKTQVPEQPAGPVIRGSMITDRAKIIINANRAVSMFGGHALSRGDSMGEKKEGAVEGGPSLADITLSSDTSLTSEEKEMLYIQLETCLNKLHAQVRWMLWRIGIRVCVAMCLSNVLLYVTNTAHVWQSSNLCYCAVQMGFNRHALINARESLVAGCHYIVNEIMQAVSRSLWIYDYFVCLIDVQYCRDDVGYSTTHGWAASATICPIPASQGPRHLPLPRAAGAEELLSESRAV